MALMKCHECGGQVSTAAKACPHCGKPLALSPALSLPPARQRAFLDLLSGIAGMISAGIGLLFAGAILFTLFHTGSHDDNGTAASAPSSGSDSGPAATVAPMPSNTASNPDPFTPGAHVQLTDDSVGCPAKRDLDALEDALSKAAVASDATGAQNAEFRAMNAGCVPIGSKHAKVIDLDFPGFFSTRPINLRIRLDDTQQAFWIPQHMVELARNHPATPSTSVPVPSAIASAPKDPS